MKDRHCLLQKSWRDDVFRYMAGVVTHKNQKSIIVNGVADHVHVFIGLRPSACLSDVIRDVKNNTTNFINEHNWLPGKFAWQEGYGAFSYAHSQLDAVYQYILNQEEHHRKKTFREEYTAFLQKFDVPYEERYLFDWLD